MNSEGHRFALAGAHLDDLEWRRHRYTGLKSYGAAKTAQLLTMRKFADYFAGSAVTVNAMHPGNVRTRIGENNGRLYRWFKRTFVLASAREPEVSARALLFLAASEELAGVSGAFFNLTSAERPAPHGIDGSRVEATWAKSLELCGLTYVITSYSIHYTKLYEEEADLLVLGLEVGDELDDLVGGNVVGHAGDVLAVGPGEPRGDGVRDRGEDNGRF